MNLRCAFCQTPYTLSRNEILFALQRMDSENLSHYDAHCPRCRRVTQIPRQRMEMAFPNWREAAVEAANTPAAPVTPAPMAPEPAAVVEQKKASPASAKPVEKAPAKKVTATKTSAKPAVKKTTAKPAAKKPVAKPKKK
jgi:hypothetical protein